MCRTWFNRQCRIGSIQRQKCKKTATRQLNARPDGSWIRHMAVMCLDICQAHSSDAQKANSANHQIAWPNVLHIKQEVWKRAAKKSHAHTIIQIAHCSSQIAHTCHAHQAWLAITGHIVFIKDTVISIQLVLTEKWAIHQTVMYHAQHTVSQLKIAKFLCFHLIVM